jgi:hypothetical protein
MHLKLIVTLPRQSPPSLAGQATAVVYSFAGAPRETSLGVVG